MKNRSYVQRRFDEIRRDRQNARFVPLKPAALPQNTQGTTADNSKTVPNTPREFKRARMSELLELFDAGMAPRVVSAAVIGPDGKLYTMPPPARHVDVVSYMHYIHDVRYPGNEPSGCKGFILSNGEFADRVLARKCAEANKQLIAGCSQGIELYSDDVW